MAGANRSGLDLFSTDEVHLEAIELGPVHDDCFENASAFREVCDGVLFEESIYEISRFHTATVPGQAISCGPTRHHRPEASELQCGLEAARSEMTRRTLQVRPQTS